MTHTITPYVYMQAVCTGRNLSYFKKTFLQLHYIYINKQTDIRILTVKEIMTRLIFKSASYYTIIDYQIHVKRSRKLSFV
jgi:hypothetical protein